MSLIKDRIDVLIIDSQVLVRQMLSQILREDSSFSNLLTMENTGNDQTLIEIEKHRPDILFLGVESVNSKNFWLLKSILNRFPDMPVVLLTPLTSQGARAALAGLKMGALEYITIPDSNRGVVLARKHFKKRVIPLIKALPKVNMRANHGNQLLISQTSSVTTQRKLKQKATVELVIISGCLGGVGSLYDVISSMSDQLPVPVIIVQHMPKIYTRELASDLDLITPLNVREAEQKSILLPGQVYVAPGGYHTIVRNGGRRNVLNIYRGPREMRYRPSIDVLLRSAVNIYQNRVMGIFLSGEGNDGVSGAKQLLDAGGEIIVQSRKSSRLWDLPGSVQSIDESINQFHSHQLGEEIISRLMYQKDSAASEPVSGVKKKNAFVYSIFRDQKN